MKFIGHSCGVALAALAVSLMATASPAEAQAPNAALIAANCAVCHGQGGSGAGDVAKINDQSPKQIADNVRAFRDGKKPSTIMGRIGKGYSDAQIDAVANLLGKK
jgi:sulfide dehydrogenase cytochrome subunit